MVPTKKTTQVLSSIRRASILASQLAISGAPSLSDLGVLLTLESAEILEVLSTRVSGKRDKPVKENTPKAALKIVLQPCHNFLQNVLLRTASLSLWSLEREVVIKNGSDCVSGGKWNKLLAFGNILPVVNEDGFDVVGNSYFD